ncbi:MAG: HAD family hydrolase [Lachnospiraceae bacterium]|nr:HAD family hydrolase [Lachnospiraceae bacterium]
MIKLIATDIDGTLVKESSCEMYPEILEAIRTWTDAGHYFCVASGRQYYSIKHIFEEVADRIIYLAENGAHVRCGEEDILVRKMKREDAEGIMKQLRPYYGQCEVVVSTADGCLLETKNKEFVKLIERGYRNKYRVVEDVFAEKADIIKIAIYQKGSIRELGENILIPAWKDKVKACMAGEEWVDFMDASVDKGNGLKVLQEYLGVGREETMVFGDNDNDIGMLQAAEESYAVESARDNVKAYAKHVCPAYQEKGVYQVIAGLLEKGGERNV